MNWLQCFENLLIVIDIVIELQLLQVSGPRLWNDLPTNITNAEFLTQFKTLMKTYFFSQVFVEA